MRSPATQAGRRLRGASGERRDGVGGRRRRRPLPARADRRRRTRIASPRSSTPATTPRFHGLSISPDLDTVIYTLAGAIDPGAGLGARRRVVAGDGSLDALRGGRARGSRAATRPGSTSAIATWPPISIAPATRGGRHAHGGHRRVRHGRGVPITLLPMTDGRCRHVSSSPDTARCRSRTTSSGLRTTWRPDAVDASSGTRATDRGARGRCDRRRGRDRARPTRWCRSARSVTPRRRRAARRPSRLGRRGVADRRRSRAQGSRRPHDGRARARGHGVGVARLYAPIASALVIDPVDADHAAAVESARACAASSTAVGMSTPDVATARLARSR